jgi:hypothetical protein
LAAFAHLTAKVLRTIVPALPWRSWMTLHVAFGLVAGIGAGLAITEPSDPEPIDWSESGLLLVVAAFVVAIGVFIGAVFGGLQAWVLRGAAQGTGLWILASAASMVILLAIVAASLPLLPPEQTFSREFAQQVAFVIGGIVAAVVMLPALKRLQPRAN